MFIDKDEIFLDADGKPEKEKSYVISRMRKYFATMSTALAMRCHGVTYVLTKDMDNIPEGIWEQYERPSLMRAPNDGAEPPDARVDTVSRIGHRK